MIRDPQLNRLNIDPKRKYYRILTELVEGAREQGLIEEHLSTASIVRDLTIISRGCMVEWILQDGRTSITEMIDETLSAYLKGIRH